MGTGRETVKLLCKSIINRLESQKAITFPPRLRQIVQDEIYDLVGPYIVTDEDIRERALGKIGASQEVLENTQFTESEQFKNAKAVVRRSLGDDELNGFYFQKSLKIVATSIREYLMRSSHIDDVFETDEELEQKIVETVKTFNPAIGH
jgi:hypothetical protein